jgi:hypothetical protein
MQTSGLLKIHLPSSPLPSTLPLVSLLGATYTKEHTDNAQDNDTSHGQCRYEDHCSHYYDMFIVFSFPIVTHNFLCLLVTVHSFLHCLLY